MKKDIKDNFKPMSKKDLSKLEIQTTKEGGFIIWTIDKTRHWLVDGSLLPIEGGIRIARIQVGHKNAVIYDKKNDIIRFMTRKK